MKRGKDEEKVVGPMFPRLHVNDREKKGGPRAPPRNKMALYEQFTIPSQRFNPNSSSHTVSHSSHGNCPEKVYTNHVSRSYTHHQSNRAYSDTLLARLEQRKEVAEDDFCACIHSKTGQSNDKTPGSFEGRKLASVGSRNLGCFAAVLSDGDKNPTQSGPALKDMRRDVGKEGGRDSLVSSSTQQLVISLGDKSTGETIGSLVRQDKLMPNREDQDCSMPNISRLHQADACLQQECVAGSLSNGIECVDSLLNSTSTSTRDMDNGNTLVPRRRFHSTANQTSPLEARNDSQYHDSGTCRLIQNGNLDGSDDALKISVVENLSTLEVSPDDVVEILGQKHFWKARQEIANQQRAFAVQVFELHRLIMVQRLISESPDHLIEDSAFIGNFPSKRSSCKKIPVKVVEPLQQNLKRQVDSKKLNNKMECSSENAIGKTSFSSLKNGSHLSNCTPFSGNPPQTNVAAEHRMGPWGFDQSPGHQWLIPVMSPSEGLVYKPYPGPGFTGTMYGQCGPFGQIPHSSTFMNSAYPIPAPHQVIRVSPFIPANNHDQYFSPKCMPVTNQALPGSAVDQVSQFPSKGSHRQNGHSSVEGVNFITHSQTSSSLPLQRNGATLHVKKLQVSKEREIQGSTTSSPSEMTQGIRTRKVSEESDKDSLSLSAGPLAPERVLQSLETRQQTQVIKVVPHNARSATESAARIFQSIQEERKQ